MATQVLSAEVNLGVSKATDNLNKLSNSLKKTTDGIKKNTAGAGVALTNLGRVASDLPFGFIAIQNNLDPLLQSFGSLQQQAGGTTGALKSIASSLAGPAGLALGFSIVSSAITVAIQKYGSLNAAIQDLFGTLSSAEKAQRALATAFGEAEAKAAGEKAELNSLLRVARDTTLSTEARKEAINKINQEYGQYLPNLTLENINTDKVNEAVKRLNKSLSNQARIRAILDLITEEEKKKQKALSTELSSQSGTWSTIKNAVLNAGGAMGGFGFEVDQTLSGFKAQQKQIKSSTEQIEIYNKELDALNQQEAVSGNLFDEKKLKAPKIKKQVEEALKAAKVALPIDTITLPSGLEIATGKTKSILKQLETQINTEAATQDFELVVPNLNLAFTPNVIAANIQALTDQMNQAFSSLQMDVFAGLGQAIGQSIMEGIPFIQSAAKVIFNAVGDFVIKIGEALIQFGIVNDAFKAAMAAGLALPGFVAIAAGVAAIAAGNLIKNVPQFANGGVVNGPTMGVLGEANKSEAIIPLDRLEAMMSNNGGDEKLIADVHGDKLRLILDRTDRRQRRNF